jgi:hypothetical protein
MIPDILPFGVAGVDAGTSGSLRGFLERALGGSLEICAVINGRRIKLSEG